MGVIPVKLISELSLTLQLEKAKKKKKSFMMRVGSMNYVFFLSGIFSLLLTHMS